MVSVDKVPEEREPPPSSFFDPADIWFPLEQQQPPPPSLEFQQQHQQPPDPVVSPELLRPLLPEDIGAEAVLWDPDPFGLGRLWNVPHTQSRRTRSVTKATAMLDDLETAVRRLAL